MKKMITSLGKLGMKKDSNNFKNEFILNYSKMRINSFSEKCDKTERCEKCGESKHTHHHHHCKVHEEAPTNIYKTDTTKCGTMNKPPNKETIQSESNTSGSTGTSYGINPSITQEHQCSKVYGNMAGMDRILKTESHLNKMEDIDKEFLKDESIKSDRSTDNLYVYSGNLNMERNPTNEKDITDELKKAK